MSDYLVELIDSFKKVQVFAVTETRINKVYTMELHLKFLDLTLRLNPSPVEKEVSKYTYKIT